MKSGPLILGAEVEGGKSAPAGRGSKGSINSYAVGTSLLAGSVEGAVADGVASVKWIQGTNRHSGREPPVSRAQVGWTVVCVDCSEDDDAGANDDIIADAVDAAPGPPRAQDIRAHPFGEPWTGAGGGSKNFESA